MNLKRRTKNQIINTISSLHKKLISKVREVETNEIKVFSLYLVGENKNVFDKKSMFQNGLINPIKRKTPDIMYKTNTGHERKHEIKLSLEVSYCN